MRIADLVFAAGGVTEKALLDNVEITRYAVINGEKRESSHFNIDLKGALAGDRAANIPLQPYDMLTVRQISNWRSAEQVTLTGELAYPGAYPIEEGEKLSAVLQRAGGFSDKAYLPAAIFTRASIKVEEQKNMDKLRQQIDSDLAHKQMEVSALKDAGLQAKGQQKLDTARRVLEQMNTLQATGRMVIELKDIRALKGSEFDLTLRDGDTLYVPQKPDEVMVIGQVYNATTFLYQKRHKRDDYVKLAGGATPMPIPGISLPCAPTAWLRPATAAGVRAGACSPAMRLSCRRMSIPSTSSTRCSTGARLS